MLFFHRFQRAARPSCARVRGRARKSRRAIGSFTATGPPQRNIAKGAFGGRFDLHVAFFDGPYELLFDASVDSKSGRGPDIGRWTTWESAVAQKRRRSAPRKASPA